MPDNGEPLAPFQEGLLCWAADGGAGGRGQAPFNMEKYPQGGGNDWDRAFGECEWDWSIGPSLVLVYLLV